MADVKTAQMNAQILIMREFLVWLLVREVAAAKDSYATARLMSEYGDARIQGLRAENLDQMRLVEIFQTEKDRIVLAVSKGLADRDSPAAH
jgi:hypothetical protein